MDSPYALDPLDKRLLTAIVGALKLRASRGGSVSSGTGTGTTWKPDYAVLVCSRHGSWAAEIRVLHGAPPRCRVALGVRPSRGRGIKAVEWRDLYIDLDPGLDPLSWDLPEPNI